MHPGAIGGIAGTVLGVIGGLIGTWASIRGASGPRERAFVIRMAVGFWIVAAAVVGLFFLISFPWRMFVFMPFPLILPFFIVFGNKRQQRIREEEEQRSTSSDNDE